MKINKFLVVALVLSLFTAGFFVPSAEAAGHESIVDIAVSNGQFSTLVAAVQAAGLVDVLDGTDEYTVFAPTNAAFEGLLNELGITAEELLANKALLTEVLLYHVAPGELTANEVLALGELRMANGDLSTISVRRGYAHINEAPISTANIQADNGVIHVIDAVILPSGVAAQKGTINATIVDIALENAGFSTLVDAVLAADLAGTLSGPGPYTVFAPTNEAFAKTLGELGITAEELLSNKALLTDILLYHVYAGSIDAQDALGMGEIQMLNGDTATVSVRNGVVYVNDASVSRANIYTRNGVIHVIDAVLIPSTK